MSTSHLSKTSLFSLGMAAMVAAGCGGDGSTGPASAGASHISSVGSATATYFGQPKPMISAATGSVTVSGLAGASFTGVNVQPTKSLVNTYLAFARLPLGGPATIYTVPYAGGQPNLLVHNTKGCFNPTTSIYGSVGLIDGGAICRIRPDGSAFTQITFSPTPFDEANLSYSPNAASLAWTEGGGLEIGPANGGTVTQIASNDNSHGIAWSPSSNNLLYTVVGSAYNNIQEIASTGGTATNVTPPGIQNFGTFTGPTWNVDGVTVASGFVQGGGTNSEIMEFGIGGTGYSNLTPSGFSDSYPSFSPDGTKIAFYRSNAGGATPGIYVENVDGSNPMLLVPDPTSAGLTGPVQGISWSPFPPSQKMIGSGANFFGFTAAGFLLSQNGAQFGSLVGFGATTPSSATITSSPNSSSAQPLVFTLTADAITEIGWTNNINGDGTVEAPGAGTTSALVTVDATTGATDSLAFAAAKPASSKDAAGNVTYTGKFSAVYDGTGKKLNASTVSQIVVSSKTGKLVSFK